MSKVYPALPLSLLGEKVFSPNGSLPGTGPLSNVNFLSRRRFPFPQGKLSVFRAASGSAITQNNQLKI